LNGSLSDATFTKLIEQRKQSGRDDEHSKSYNIDYSTFKELSLADCFEKFKIAHELVDNVDAVKLAAECVISEFAADNVIYLELRSTPRETPFMTKSECLQAVIDTIVACSTTYPKILVKFLPSINISQGRAEAEANFALFCELRDKYPNIVRGIDLSGDPSKGSFKDYLDIFQQARAKGFGIAIHCAEVNDEAEIIDKLEFMAPNDRIGHGTFINGRLVNLKS